MRRRKSAPPPLQKGVPPQRALGILELDRFSQENLTRWRAVSQDLDELQAVLYFGLVPEQRRLRAELIAALSQTQPVALPFSRWTRVVTFQFSMEPLSAAGSLHAFGGRFNPGMDLDPGTLDPWPALYIAEDVETALREKFQMAWSESVGGLRPNELALAGSTSFSALSMNGMLHRVFDMTTAVNLREVAKVLGRIKMPSMAREIQKRLGIRSSGVWMITTGQHLYDAVITRNWRTLPVQFGLPAPSHTLAELVRAAGFEAILFRSTKGQGRCVAVFPDRMVSGSYVDLADRAPTAVKHARLSLDSADDLSGWDSLPSQKRPRK